MSGKKEIPLTGEQRKQLFASRLGFDPAGFTVSEVEYDVFDQARREFETYFIPTPVQQVDIELN